MSTLPGDLIQVAPPKRLGRYLAIGGTVFIIFASAWFAGFDPVRILANLNRGGRLLGKMFFQPDWAYVPGTLKPLLETLMMAVVGTFWGALLGFPVAVLSARNFMKKSWLPHPLRFFLNIARSIPPMVMAAVFVAIFGIGAFGGVVALALFTFGLIAKLTFESIEAIDPGQMEALEAVGGDKLTVLRWGIVPQVLPQFVSYTLYAFEINVRAAAVLGYVGAGGIGQLFEQNLAWRNFDRVGVIIIVSFAVVLVIDLLSSALRRKLV